MTKEEEKVIQEAFNLTDAIVAGDYDMPGPMTLAINLLQDAVHELAMKRKISVKDGCSQDFLETKAKWIKDVQEKLLSEIT